MVRREQVEYGPIVETRDVLFSGKVGLEVTGIVTVGLSLRNLDVQGLNFARQLEDLVLNLSDLERIGCKTSDEQTSVYVPSRRKKD